MKHIAYTRHQNVENCRSYNLQLYNDRTRMSLFPRSTNAVNHGSMYYICVYITVVELSDLTLSSIDPRG